MDHIPVSKTRFKFKSLTKNQSNFKFQPIIRPNRITVVKSVGTVPTISA